MFNSSLFGLFSKFLDLEASYESVDFKLLKRKLLAEFELNDNQPIPFEDKFIGKTEALEFLSKLENKEFFEEQQILAKNQDLVDFLEGRSFNFLLDKENYSFQIFESIEENFSERFSTVLANAFQQKDRMLFCQIMLFPYSQLRFSPLDKLLRKIKNELSYLEYLDNQNDAEKQYLELADKLSDYSEDKAKILNALPIEYGYLRDKIANTLINISSNIFNTKQEKKVSKAICTFVVNLDIRSDLKRIAVDNFKVISNQSSNVATVLLVMFLIIVILSNLGKTSKPNVSGGITIINNNKTIQEIAKDAIVLGEKINYADSISKTLNLEIRVSLLKTLSLENINKQNKNFESSATIFLKNGYKLVTFSQTEASAKTIELENRLEKYAIIGLIQVDFQDTLSQGKTEWIYVYPQSKLELKTNLDLEKCYFYAFGGNNLKRDNSLFLNITKSLGIKKLHDIRSSGVFKDNLQTDLPVTYDSLQNRIFIGKP